MKRNINRITSIGTAAALAAALAGCTIVLTEEVGGTSSGAGGVLDPMLAIFEEELDAAYSQARGARGLAGGANSIKHGLPSTTVAKVREQVRGSIAAAGLEKSRDLAKIAPAIATATAAALKDPAVVGDAALSEAELIQVNAVASRGIAKSLNAQGVTAIAEGLGTAAERQARLEALTQAASGNASTLGISNASLGDALQKVLLMVVDAGNADLDPAGSGASAPEALLSARASSLVAIAASRLDGKLTGTACGTALNDLANAAVIGLGGTTIASSSVDATGAKLQSVVQDGVLTGLFLAYYKFTSNAALSASALRGAIDFAGAVTAIGTGSFADRVSANVQAVRDTIVPAAETKARKAAIIDTANPPTNELAGATAAASVAAGASKTWTAGSAMHVTGDVSVSGNLTIEPGVVVYLEPGCDIDVGTAGSISAVGTAAAPIVFRRAVSGSAWGSIVIDSNSASNKLAYCDISGATRGVIIATMSSDPGIAEISNCLVHDNVESGIDAWDAKTDSGRKTAIIACHFYGNGSAPIGLNQNVTVDEATHFYNPATATSPDFSKPSNVVAFNAGVTANYTLTVTEVAYAVGDSISVSSPAVLTVNPGVVVKLESTDYVYIAQGARIKAEGIAAKPIVFTSYRDGSAGGDSVGQGNAGTAGDWEGVDLRSSGNSFAYCEFRYAQTGVQFNNIGASAGDGAGAFSNCVFRDCSIRGFHGYAAGPGTAVSSSSFYRNSSYPATITEDVALDATNIFHEPGTTAPAVPAGANKAIEFRGAISGACSFKITELPYIIYDSMSVNSPGILTIDPGVVVKLQSTDYLIVGQGARIKAEGGSDKHIVFTSYRDGSAGGDTAGQGNAGTAGDWEGVDLRSSGNSFAYCEFRYAQTGVQFNNIGASAGDGAGTFSNCVFRDCSIRGFHGYAAGPGTAVSSSSFYGNSSYPATITEDVALDATNIFHEPGAAAPAVPAGANKAVEFRGAISGPYSFKITELPYIIYDSLNVNAPGSLAIDPGVVVKLQSTDSVTVGQGARLRANGNAAAHIVFTSYRDGSAGGDTAGQGEAGLAGDWSGMDLRSIGNELAYCEIRYAVKALRFDNYGASAGDGGAAIDNSVIRNCSNGGIDATDAASTTSVTNCVFTGNAANGTTIWDLDISGNSKVTASGNTATYTRP